MFFIQRSCRNNFFLRVRRSTIYFLSLFEGDMRFLAWNRSSPHLSDTKKFDCYNILFTIHKFMRHDAFIILVALFRFIHLKRIFLNDILLTFDFSESKFLFIIAGEILFIKNLIFYAIFYDTILNFTSIFEKFLHINILCIYFLTYDYFLSLRIGFLWFWMSYLFSEINL